MPKKFEQPGAPEEEGVEVSADIERENLRLQGREMASVLNLPSEQLEELGFDRGAKAKAGKERAEELLDEQIGILIKRLMSSERPEMETVRFHLPDSMSPEGIHTYDLMDAFAARANTVDENGKRLPLKILGDKQLKLTSISRERREGGHYVSDVSWKLGLKGHNPEEEAKSQSL